MEKPTMSLSDIFTKKIESEPENAGHYRERANRRFENGKFDLALNDYNKAIQMNPKITDYFERGLTHFKMKNHDKAIDDFNTVIAFKPAVWNFYFKFEVPFSYLFRAYCYYKSGNEGDLSSFESKLKNDLPFGTYSFIRRTFSKKFQKYTDILKETVTDSSTYFMLKVIEFLLEGDYKKHYKLACFLDDCELNKELPEDIQHVVSKIFQYYPKFLGSLLNTLERDGKQLFLIRTKLSILEYSCSHFLKNKILKLLLLFTPFLLFFFINWLLSSDIGIVVFLIWIFVLVYEIPRFYFGIASLYFIINKTLQERSIELLEQKEQEKAQARVAERNKIIADLSHSIKNLISTIIDPLKNLRKEKELKPAVIDDALKGANLIREIVNAMNLSFRGSAEDFYYDAHNTGRDRTDLQSAFTESLIYSVGNMFDGKYFPDFQAEYFDSEDILNQAESEWTQISQTKGLQELTAFLRKYFFEPDFSLGRAADYAMGNEKGSAIKLLVLFQELILNAVKYSAFVSREHRYLRIHFADTPEQIAVRIENRYNDRINVSTSGIGHVIVENFCKLMETEPLVNRENGTYTVDIRFANFWKETGR
jgi:tetratricopeptide (TPR) repeat protein